MQVPSARAATPRGLHRVGYPEVAGREEAAAQLELALEHLRDTAGANVTGNVSDADAMAAISTRCTSAKWNEIIISTLSRRLSRWMHLDLPSKVRGLGRPVTHVEGVRAPAERELAGERVA